MKDKLYNFFEFISEYALYGLLFFLSISNALVEFFVALLILAFVGRKIIKPDFKFVKFWPNIFLFLFFLFSALSLINSGVYLSISLHALFGKWMKYLCLCMVIQESIYDEKIIKRGIFVFLSGAFLTILSGLSQYFFGFEFLRNRGIGVDVLGTHAITSSFTHYNAFGGYLVVVLSIVIVLLLAYDSFDLKTFGFLIFSLFSTVVIMLTFSRGSWVAMIISVVFIFVLFRKNHKRLIPLLFVVIVMLLLSKSYERMLFTFKDGGDSDRFRYWLVAWKMINQHPFFGMGVGTFMANFSKFLPDSFVSYAHNCYLQIWAETGIFSLLSFIAFVVTLVYLGIKKFIILKDFLLLGLLSGAVGFLVHSFFDTNLYSLRLAILFWVWVGLIIAKSRKVYSE